MLDFYEDPKESSQDIYNSLKGVIKKKLGFDNLIAYTAENASVNYASYKSAFVNFKNENQNIVKANCNCYIIHDAAKYGFNQLPFDAKNFLLKVYSHFSKSAKRVNTLKSCYDFTEEYSKLLRHVPTRWLSLFPATSKLNDNIEAVKSYFIGIGEECHKIISEFVYYEGNISSKN